MMQNKGQGTKGRGQYHSYSHDMDRTALEHIIIKRDLHHAIEKDQFFLVFQPQVDATSGRTVRCEALIRWHTHNAAWCHRTSSSTLPKIWV